MAKFFRAIGAFLGAVRSVIANLIFLVIVVLIVVAIVSSDTMSVPESAALTLRPTGAIVEQKRMSDPVSLFLNGGSEAAAETRLADLLNTLHDATDDPRIRAMVLELGELRSASPAALEELGAAIEAFRDAGKPVFAFGRAYSQIQYYLAVHADEVYLDRNTVSTFGGVFLTGFGTYPLHFKAAIDRFNVDYHVYRAGEFKSAVEPFLRDDMSEATESANLTWLTNLWDRYATTVTRYRGIERRAFDRYTNEYHVVLQQSGNNALQLAVDQELVDGLISKQEFAQRVQDVVGGDGEEYPAIDDTDYLAISRPSIPVTNPGLDKVAVITARGVIYDGQQLPGNVGGDTVSELIRDARRDQSIKAVVLRVDSPGGSAAAAEQIRAELELTQQAGKPVVVSMGGYAASGGYWISATANKIFANESTVTGSIGAYLVRPSFSRLAGEYGVHVDGIGTTRLSGALDPLQPINPIMAATFEQSIAHTYDTFLETVARGRGIGFDSLGAIAEGRVWTGTQALENGLVDAIGNLDSAVSSAALLADSTDYDVIFMEQALSPRDRLLREILTGVETLLPAGWARSLTSGVSLPIPADLQWLAHLAAEPGIYAHCDNCRLY